MPLNTAQLAILKTNFLANTNTIPVGRPLAGQIINALPNTPDANEEIARWYNLTASPTWYVWRDISIDVVLGQISYANMTPLDSVPTVSVPPTEQENAALQIWIARSLACQGKQFNLQNLTLGRNTATMKRANYRNALSDCLTNIPAGAGGSLISANWVGVRDAAKFAANNIEKVLSTGTGSFASPADLSFEGIITRDDVENARNS